MKLFNKLAVAFVGGLMAISVGVGLVNNRDSKQFVNAAVSYGFKLLEGGNGADCKVNDIDGVKIGTSSKGGFFSVSIPANTSTVTMSAAAWRGVSSLSLAIDNVPGVTISPQTLELTAADGATGNSPFTITDDSKYNFTLSLSGVLSDTELKFTTSVAKRCVVWNFGYEVGGKKITEISVTTPPNKTEYTVGDKFDSTGMVVTGTFDDDSTEAISGYEIEPSGMLGLTDTQITISYNGFTTTQNIHVSPKTGVEMYELVSSTSELIPGSKYLFASTANGETKVISKVSNVNNRKTVSSTSLNGLIELSDDMMPLTLDQESNGYTFFTNGYLGDSGDGYLDATNVTDSNYLKVNNSSTPSNYAYFTISFGGNSKAIITCTGKSSRNIVRVNGDIISCYSSGQADVYLYRQIDTKELESISITSNPSKLAYYVGEEIDTTGLVVTARYDNDDEAVITSLVTFSTYIFEDAADNLEITVSYTEKSITKTASFFVRVNIARTLESISISGDMINKNYYVGDDWDYSGLSLLGHFSSGDDEVIGSLSDLIQDDSLTFECNPEKPTLGGTTLEISDIMYIGSLYSCDVASARVISDISVVEDVISSLSWTNRGYDENTKIYIGDVLSSKIACSSWSFKGKHLSSLEETLTFGTGSLNVHVALYDTSTPSTEAQPSDWLDEDYIFKASDKGKYLVACYGGSVFSTKNIPVNVLNWRLVNENTEVSATITWSSTTETIDSTAGLTQISVAKGGSTTYENGSLRLGSGKYDGSITITSSSNTISKIEVTCKQYGSDTSTLYVNGTSQTVNDVNQKYTFENIDSNNVELSAVKSARVNISEVIVYSGGNVDISKTEKAINTVAFCDSYMHLEIDFSNTSGTGMCLGDQGYYALAKQAFNALSKDERTLFVANSAFSNEYNRLVEWARINGEEFTETDNGYILESTRQGRLLKMMDNSSGTIVMVATILSLSTFGGYFFIRRKKEI